jgi:anaerobic magnesium-protoporphyrin IX monomethyl ester cyclase
MEDGTKAMNESMGKIVLFRGKPNNEPIKETLLPLGLMAISAPLDREGYDISIIDSTVDDDYVRKVLEKLEGAVCLGISTMTGYQIREGLEVAKAAKEKYPDIPIVWGGFHPSILPHQTMQNQFVDIVVVGQGERTFQDLVHHLQHQKPLKDVQGILYKEKVDGNLEVRENPARPFESMDNFPSYAFNLVDVERYVFGSEFAERTVNYVSSYGCFHRCTFCAEHKMFKRHWIPKDAKMVVDDLQMLVDKYKVEGVLIDDNNFFQNPQRAEEICKEILRRGLKVRWGRANGRTGILGACSDEFWDLVKRAGCFSIYVGAESGCQEVLNFIDKDINTDTTLVVARKAADRGIQMMWAFMIGFPHTDEFKVPIEEEFGKTLDLIGQINDISTNHIIMWSLFTPFPETPIYEASLKAGFKDYDSLEGWSNHNIIREVSETDMYPWVPAKYVYLVRMMNVFIFPFISSSYMYLAKDAGKRRLWLLSWAATPVAMLFHKTATWRLRHKYFGFPAEYKTLRLFLSFTAFLSRSKGDKK